MKSASHEGIRCTVEGEGKLPSELGGQAAICSAIASAVLPQLQGAGIAPDAVEVQVFVKSKYMFSAVVSVNGVPRPEQTVGVTDRALNERAVQMLAQAVAGELAK